MIFKHSPVFWNKIGTLIKPLTSALNVAIGRTTSLAKLSVQSDGTNDILNLFETGGTEVMTVLESGNVGIGMTNPGGLLHVGNTVSNNMLYNGGDLSIRYGTNNRVQITQNSVDSFGAGYGPNGSGAMRIGNGTNFAYISTNGTSLLLNSITGNVGIGTTTPTSKLHTAGSFSAGYVSKSSNYTLTIADYTVECTTGTFTCTLPTAVGITGRMYNIKNTGTGVITVDGAGTETIDGELTQTLIQWECLQLMSNGTNWIVL